MVFAADYPFLYVFWTMIVFFSWVIWIWIVIMGPLGRVHAGSPRWGKAAWVVFVIVLPFLGVLIYLIANGSEMTQRRIEHSQRQQSQFDDYVKTVASPGGAAGEIEKAKGLLDSGTITQAEFDSLKAKALAT